jgi:cytochrome P450
MMQPMEVIIRAATVELIGGFIAQGECEFMHDFASILPVSIFLGMMDLPLSDREKAHSARRRNNQKRLAADAR